MAQTIQIKRNNTDATKKPSSLVEGELAVNLLDRSLFTNNGTSVVQLYTGDSKWFDVNGVANNANKLGGNSASHFATASQITALNTSLGSTNNRVTALEATRYWANVAVSTKSDSNTAPTFSPDFKINLTSNTAIAGSKDKAIGTPLGKYLWHDILAFGVNGYPTVTTSPDGGTTWNLSEDNNLIKKPFIQREDQTITVLDDNKTVIKWEWYNSSFHACNATFLNIGFAYSAKQATFTIRWETSTDGINYTTGFLKEGAKYGSTPYWFYLTTNWSSAYWVRLTLTKTSDTGTSANISGIKLLSYRWGNQGRGSEYESPYSWDLNQNIFPRVNNSSTLGTSSAKWANVYATTFTGALAGNASTATKLAAAKSIGLSGDVSGSANFDGSENVTITATVANNSHTHILSNITDLGEATTSKAGLISAKDKTKLDGIATGATANTGTVTKVSAGVGLAGGDITTTGTIKANLKSETKSSLDSASMGSTSNRQYAVGVDKSGYLSVNVPWTDNDTTYEDATTTVSGLMSASDKTKLDGIASGAEVNVQSDWNVTDTSSDAYIKNKPTIPTSLKSPYKLLIGTKEYDGSSEVEIVASDLGLSNAMKYIGKTSTSLSDGSTTNIVVIGGLNVTAETGNVVIDSNDKKEYIWNGSKWEEFGNEGNYKVVQDSVSSPTASGNATSFIDTISQDTNGKISATKKTIPTATSEVAGLMPASDKLRIDSTVYHYYGECATAAATAAKVVDIDNFELKEGAIVTIKFTYANSVASPTLNVNSTGAKPMRRYGTTNMSTGTTTNGWVAGAVLTLVYDGSAWIKEYWNNTTYSNVSLGQGYATCNTAAATTAKVATLSSYALVTGGVVSVKFDYDVPASATLNVNSKGAKSIYYQNKAITAGIIKGGDTATFIYSTQYHLISVDRTRVDVDAEYTSGHKIGSISVDNATTDLYIDSIPSSILDTAYLPLAGGTLTGKTKISTNAGTNPFVVMRTSETEATSFYQDDNGLRMDVVNDESQASVAIKLQANDTENSNGSNASTNTVTIQGTKSGSSVTATSFIGTASNANSLTSKPTLNVDGNTIAVTAGGKTSDYITVPYATSAASATKATQDANGNTITSTYATKTELATKLDKTTYQYNKQLNLGGSGKVCIGKFPMYDSNVSVEIKSTTSTTYCGTLVIATQNINTTGGGTYTATVYGDASNTLTPNIKIQYLSGSVNFEVYIDLPGWSKNLLHIQCSALKAEPTDIAVLVDAIPSTATIVPTNALTQNFASKSVATTSANGLMSSSDKTKLDSNITISGKTVGLGGTISQADLRSGLGLGSLAYKSSVSKSDVGLGSVTNLAASGYLTDLSSTDENAVSITVGGTTKSITVANMRTSLGLGTLAYKSSVSKADVGLGNVENTALSTWTGSSKITTVGTLTSLSVSGTSTFTEKTTHNGGIAVAANKSIELGSSQIVNNSTTGCLEITA